MPYVDWDGYVTLDNLSELPERSGIYAVFMRGKCQYIGQSKNLRGRLRTHDRKAQMNAAQQHSDIQVCYKFVEPQMLFRVETDLIHQLQPLWNRGQSHVTEPKTIQESRLEKRIKSLYGKIFAGGDAKEIFEQISEEIEQYARH